MTEQGSRKGEAGSEEGDGAHRAALIVMQLGALAVVLAASPYKNFELDRFFIPKELALHITALLAVVLCIRRVRSVALDRVDTLLVGYLGLSILSTLAAKDWSLSTRALAITLSGAAVFWAARGISAAGLRRPLVIGLVVAIVVGALTSLMQAYGVETEYASLSRAPGGTFGNRNFMAHLCAIGLPLLFWCMVTARRAWGVGLGAVAAVIFGAALVLSRTRAAWVAVAVCVVVLAIPMRLVLRQATETRIGSRLRLLLLASAAGVLAALLLPNHLNWKSDSPYIDSVRGVVDYSNGSGKGRVIQYKNTARMALAHPILGVGPGNWPVYYPRYASKHDPSLSQTTGAPANPWPSSDWMALIAERGVAAALLFVLTLFGLLVTVWRKEKEGTTLGERDFQDAPPFTPLILAATIIMTALVGTFDAVLLLAAPTLIVWAAFGALSVPGKARATLGSSQAARRGWVGAIAVVGTLMVARNVAQMAAMASNCHWPAGVVLDRCRTAVRRH